MFITLTLYTSTEQKIEISNNADGDPKALMLEVKELDNNKPAERLYLNDKDVKELSLALRHAQEMVKEN